MLGWQAGCLILCLMKRFVQRWFQPIGQYLVYLVRGCVLLHQQSSHDDSGRTDDHMPNNFE